MGSQTAKGFPYPVGTDRVMDGDDAIRALAEKIDSAVGVMASGQATVVIPSGAFQAPVAVTFPAGRFATPPNVVCTTGSGNFLASWNAVTATGFNLYASHKQSTVSPGNVPCSWMANL